MTTIPALIARRLRTETELPERERMLADKTAAARAAEAGERRQRAEQHRIAALPALADSWPWRCSATPSTPRGA